MTRAKILGAYALPAVGIAAPTFFVQFYFLAFATDVLLLSPAVIGVLLGLGRVWDAVTDPWMGYASDRTQTRLGRRRPWLFVAAPCGALAFVALWNPPPALTPASVVAWSAVALFAFTAATTAWSVPHQAWGAELAEDSRGRMALFGALFVASVTGAAISFGGMQYVATASDPGGAAAYLAVGVGLVTVPLLWLPPLVLREGGRRRVVERAGPWRVASEVGANRDARGLCLIWFFAQMGAAAQGIVAPYMASYVLRRPEMTGVLPALYITPMVVSVPFWVWLARRVGPRSAWFASVVGAGLSYLFLFPLSGDDVFQTSFFLGLAGFLSGCTGPVGPTLFAGLVDREAERTGIRREGAYFGAKEFTEKTSAAAAALCVGIALEVSGFEPNVEQSDTARAAIRGCVSVLPGGALLVAAWLLRSSSLGQDGDRSFAAYPTRSKH